MKYEKTWRFVGLKTDSWICGFWWVGFDCISLGVSVCLQGNLEIHLPFCFFVIGRKLTYSVAAFDNDGAEIRFY